MLINMSGLQSWAVGRISTCRSSRGAGPAVAVSRRAAVRLVSVTGELSPEEPAEEAVYSPRYINSRILFYSRWA